MMKSVLATLIVVVVSISLADPQTTQADAGQPQLIGSVTPELQAAGFTSSILVHGERAYIAAWSNGVIVIDLSDNRDPKFLAEVSDLNHIGFSAHDLALVGHHLFVGTSSLGLVVVDVKNPKSPRGVGKLEISQNIEAVAARGDLALIAGGHFHTVDISQPTRPSIIAEWATETVILDIVLDGDLAYLAARTRDSSEGYVLIVDVGDPQSPRLVGQAVSASVPRKIVLRGDYIYAASGKHGLEIYDVSDPAAASLVGSLPTSATAYAVTVAGATAYLFAGKEGLFVADCTDPTAPTLRSTLITASPVFQGTTYANLVVGTGSRCETQVFQDLYTATAQTADGAYPGRVYKRKRTDSSYGTDYFLFLDGANMAEFPLFSPNPPNAFRFAEMTAATLKDQKLEALAKGWFYLDTNMSLSTNILKMDRLPALADFYAQHIAGKDMYELQANKEAFYSDLLALHAAFQAEHEKLKGCRFVFEYDSHLDEKEYDFDTGALNLRPYFAFFPPGDSRVGWKYAKRIGFTFPFPLPCEGDVVKATFTGAPGEFGQREVRTHVTMWTRLTGGRKLESLYDTFTDVAVDKILIETEATGGLQNIVIEKKNGNWGATVQ